MFRLCLWRSVFIVTFCALSFGLAIPTPAAAEKVPRTAKLSLQDMNGKRVRLRDLRGQIVVLNFWATWCGPCNDEMPMLVKADDQYRSQGVIFLGASLDDSKTRNKIPAFVDRYNVHYSILTGASAGDLAKLKMGIAIPATAFIDANGIIRFRILGQMQPGELQERINWLLHGQAGPAPVPLVVHLDKNERGN